MTTNKSSLRWPHRHLLALVLVLFAAVLPLQAVQAQADPNQGPGGPILVLTSGTTNFGRFYAEMLRTEGFNSFTVADISAVSETMLNNYDVVVLAKTSVSASQATLFTNWVNAGGNLIAMDPAPQLASLLGITQTGSNLANGYLRVDTTTKVGSGIIGDTLQFHGSAQLSTLNGASALATLYSNATTATTYPAVTLRSVGAAGGQAAAFAYDLATSIVYTRQGNPAWATAERDGVTPVRSDDKFFGASASDPQPDWIDLSKVAIPQADEQQRLFANLIIAMNLDRKPLPRFWYFPNGHKAVVMMTGDDHGFFYSTSGGNTAARFQQFLNASPAGCSVDNWECVRGTSYIFPNSALTNAQAVAFQTQGFEISPHIQTLSGSTCLDYTATSLQAYYTDQVAAFTTKFPGVSAPRTQRHHCIVWSDWVSGAKVQFNNGMRLDTSYYYWPPGWVQNVPGHFTGSAMPMRFADLDGTLVDVFQVVTQMTDESQQLYPFTVNTLLDRAIGSEEQYGVYTVNAHIDVASSVEADSVVASAQERSVPVVSSKQMLTWLDARNASSIGSMGWAGNALSFTVTRATGAAGLEMLLPRRTASLILATVQRGTTDVPYEVTAVKGVEYAVFSVPSGNYVATYVADTTAPTITNRFPASGATGAALSTPVNVSFSEPLDPTTVTTSTIELRTSGGTLVPATVTYTASTQTARLTPNASLLASSTYSVTVRGGTADPRIKDLAGNALASNSTWSFSTVAGPTCPCTIWDASAVPAVASVADSAVELGVKFRSDLDGYIKGIRFYKGAGNTGTHVAKLWSSTGQLLASAPFSSETATGWQQVNFPTAVAITANTTYVASYYAPNGGYSVNAQYFSSTGVDNQMLHALSTAAGAGNGVYVYGNGSAFPSSTYQGSNYWVDVAFDTTAPADGTAPTVTITSPTNAATYSTSATPLALSGTASDNVGVTAVTWTNDRGGSGTATGTTSWSIGSVALQSGTNIISVTARDASNNTSVDSLTVTYTPGTPDTTPPTITTRVPGSGATGIATNSTVTVTFSEPMAAATISTSTIELRDASNALVASGVSYNAASNTATLTPNAVLNGNSSYSVTVRGGSSSPRVTDVAGNPLGADSTWSFTTGAATYSIWASNQGPAASDADSDPTPVTLGTRFRASANGQITALRFYKNTANTGTHVGALWAADGTPLASQQYTSETASGWQQVQLSTPVNIVANAYYVVSYHSSSGSYTGTDNMFATSGITNGLIYAPRDGEAGANGVYRYGASSTFPDQTYNSEGYWADVVFTPASSGPDTTAPTISSRTPASGATGVSTAAAVTVTFNEAMTASTISTSTIELRNPSNVVVPAAVSYNATSLTATLVPSSALSVSTTYTVTVRGGTTDPRVKDAAGNALAANATWSFTTAATSPCGANSITAENCLTGNPASEWDISGAGDSDLQGFATNISVNRGGTVQFKVKTSATGYRLDIYRMGYYGGLGARKVDSINPSATLPQSQPACLTVASTGLIDCGNWAVSASWTVPATATSGIYFAKLVKTAGGSGSSHIVFIVRNDSSTSDLVFQTSDTTWQAYNNYGGNSLYMGSPGTNPGRAYKVSYNRPFNTRAVDGGQDWVFNSEYPMVRWLEANGYDVSYIAGVDTDRAGSLLTNHRTFLSVGHDEYWSAPQRTNVENARNAGVNLAFFSGNEMFWKIRFENSIDGSGTTYRTVVSYKETHANAKIDPSAEWTGTWRDPRFSPPADGGRPENAVTGTIFTVNSGTSAIQVPAEEGKLRLWRGIDGVANLGTGQVATLTAGTLGYEWDSDLDNGARPAGLVRMSDTTVSGVDQLQDYGSTYATGTANHALTFYKHSSGARVFGAGTIQWTWGLDANHDRAGSPADIRMQQATVNLFADMNVQPATLQSNLSAASASTDTTAPTTVISTPAASATVPVGVALSITGTASDTGGAVGGVEVSTDGSTWHPATGRTNWTYLWTPPATGSVTIRVRAVDDSGNLQSTPTTRTVTVGTAASACPCSIWSASQAPTVSPDVDPGAVVLGTRFRSNVNGKITAIRFYKSAGNTGTHVGKLWSSTGTELGSVTFSGETASGWQQMALATPINITANTWYVVSYSTSSGNYIGQDGQFATSGITNGPLYAAANGEGGGNGVYAYGSSSTFPNLTYNSEGYWVDVVFTTP